MSKKEPTRKPTRIRKNQVNLALTHARMSEALAAVYAAFADMPIKYRNVLLPALSPLFQDSFALLFRLRECCAAAVVDEETNRAVKCQVEKMYCDFMAAIEFTLRLRALPPGRVAQTIEALAKAMP